MAEIFPGLRGNKELKDTLGADIRSGKAAHAYILSGPTGSGKHTAARQICAAIACTDRNGDLPCGKCSQCHKILTDISADVRFIRREDRATIGVEQIRTVKEELYITPNDGDCKFYIIEDAQTMTPQAQNALLLSLEEPPEFVTFLLLATDPAALLETIRSRAPVLPMELFSRTAVEAYLREDRECARIEKTDPDRFTAAAIASLGALGQAKTLLTTDPAKAEPLRQRAYTMQLLDFVFCKRLAEGIAVPLKEMPKSRETIVGALYGFQTAVRDLIARKRDTTLPPLYFIGTENVIRAAQKVSVNRLVALYDLAGATIAKLLANGAMVPVMSYFLLTSKKQ